MGKEVVYVSGRVRAPGEMNGKSGNMNNALSQIYPKEYAIPGNEVVCVFDADQVAKRDFFLKTLPYFDAGEAPSAHLMALDMCSCSKGPVYVYGSLSGLGFRQSIYPDAQEDLSVAEVGLVCDRCFGLGLLIRFCNLPFLFWQRK